MKEVKIIGITGGVGSGKSTVIKLMCENCDAKAILAEEIGHEALVPGSATYEKITEHFGKSILDKNAEIDHAKLADVIYSDNTEKEFLNSVVHPYALDRIREEIKAWRQTETPLLIIETALMFETGCDALCDEVWLVTADESTRIDRLSRSRGYSEDKSRAIIAAQQPDSELAERCDRVIENNGTPEMINEVLLQF